MKLTPRQARSKNACEAGLVHAIVLCDMESVVKPPEKLTNMKRSYHPKSDRQRRINGLGGENCTQCWDELCFHNVRQAWNFFTQILEDIVEESLHSCHHLRLFKSTGVSFGKTCCKSKIQATVCAATLFRGSCEDISCFSSLMCLGNILRAHSADCCCYIGALREFAEDCDELTVEDLGVVRSNGLWWTLSVGAKLKTRRKTEILGRRKPWWRDKPEWNNSVSDLVQSRRWSKAIQTRSRRWPPFVLLALQSLCFS